jgi:hypothetical protein
VQRNPQFGFTLVGVGFLMRFETHLNNKIIGCEFMVHPLREVQVYSKLFFKKVLGLPLSARTRGYSILLLGMYKNSSNNVTNRLIY